MLTTRRALLAQIGALLVASPARHVRAQDAPQDLTLARGGALPIIITAPHGGRAQISGVAPRGAQAESPAQGEQRWGGRVLQGDLNTDRLAGLIAEQIEHRAGRAPYLVVAHFARRFIDANRPAGFAFDDAKAGPYYDYYHGAIARFVAEIRSRYPAGLLVDVHGQGRAPDVVMRGTENGRTVTRLVARAGPAAITGQNGLFGQLERNGFRVFPDNALAIGTKSESGGFDGGYTVATYGSGNASGIDAFQLEFGSDYRRPDGLQRTAEQTANAILAFYDAYLKDAKGAPAK